jgi:hypothetical protein
MKTKIDRSSWVAFGLFYIILVLIVSLLDTVNGVLELPYWGIQVGLITIGVGVFVLVGLRAPELTTGLGVLLAFTIGILTIIPAVLMGLGKIPGLWPQYFYIAFGMAAGSFLTYLFLKLTQRLIGKEQPEFKRERFK